MFEPLPVAFSCNCSRERTLNALASIPKADIQELLEELGSITVPCVGTRDKDWFTVEFSFTTELIVEIVRKDGSRYRKVLDME